MNLDYKHTLNLPQTDFPMKANLAEREPAQLQRWAKLDLYAARQRLATADSTFIMHDGPPYANGNIHIGHAVNKILKDIICRVHYLNGQQSPFVPGWDCHGLPIEINVEKKWGKVGTKISAKEFRQKCREYAQEQVNKQREDFKRLGILADWDHPYLTMDYSHEANALRAIGKIIARGHLQQGVKPVYWCFDCGSSLAEAEVEYHEKTSPAIDVMFAVENADDLLSRCEFLGTDRGHGEVYVVIWTTTPWTLPANRAVALHPDLTYTLIQKGNSRYIFAEALIEAAMGRYGCTEYQRLATVKGKDLEHLLLQHPFYNRCVPVILGEHVTVDTGTGAVHTAPSHGEDDYRVGQKYQLPMDFCVLPNGTFANDVELFAGQHVWQANASIIDVLRVRQRLLQKIDVKHSYPHCWRHKTPLIFRATPQWFISMDQNDLRNAALQSTALIQWLPQWGKERMQKMLENRPDWCISRQRSWGVPIAVFVHKQTQTLHPRTLELIEQVAKLVEKNSIEAWFELNIDDLLTAEECDDYFKVTDVLDVWFDSGLTHDSVLSQGRWPNLHFPADVYLEGSDQYRGWFQSSLLTSLAIHYQGNSETVAVSDIPFKKIITHGFTVDAQGRKMSKSLGNVIAPDEVIKQYGADVLRLWVSNTDYTGEMTISNDILKRTVDMYRRLRNTARYLLSNLHDFDPCQHALPAAQWLSIDRFAVHEAYTLQNRIQQDYLENFTPHLVVKRLHDFCAQFLGGFYLDVCKDRQYTGQKNGRPRRAAQNAMYHILQALVRWIAPILAFTADEIWEHLPVEKNKLASVHLARWYQDEDFQQTSEEEYRHWQRLLAIREVVNKELEVLRQKEQIGSALEAKVRLFIKDKDPALFFAGNDLRFIFITSEAEVCDHNDRIDHALAIDALDLSLQITPSTEEKCARCWHHVASVNHDPEYPGLCLRCIDTISGKEESREIA